MTGRPTRLLRDPPRLPTRCARACFIAPTVERVLLAVQPGSLRAELVSKAARARGTWDATQRRRRTV